LEISALFFIPRLWFAQNSGENSIGFFGIGDKSFYMSLEGLSTVFLRRTEIFYRETKIFHFGSGIFSLGFNLFTAHGGWRSHSAASRSRLKGIKTAKS
jgi:hypothetical protein